MAADINDKLADALFFIEPRSSPTMSPDKNKVRATQNIQLFPWFRDISRKRAEKLIKEGNIEMMKYSFM